MDMLIALAVISPFAIGMVIAVRMAWIDNDSPLDVAKALAAQSARGVSDE